MTYGGPTMSRPVAISRSGWIRYLSPEHIRMVEPRGYLRHGWLVEAFGPGQGGIRTDHVGDWIVSRSATARMLAWWLITAGLATHCQISIYSDFETTYRATPEDDRLYGVEGTVDRHGWREHRSRHSFTAIGLDDPDLVATAEFDATEAHP